MKTKEKLKKLSLNKEIIANLNRNEQQWVKGGDTDTEGDVVFTRACGTQTGPSDIFGPECKDPDPVPSMDMDTDGIC